MANSSDTKNTGLKVALILVSILLVVSLIAVYYVYTNPPETQDQINTLQNQKASLESQVTDLQNQISDLETQINSLQDQQPSNSETNVADLQAQLDSLQSAYDNYVTTHSYSNSQYDELINQITLLQNQVNTLQASNLVMNVEVTNHRPLLQTPYCHVVGEVWNVGTTVAQNCKLHIVLYQDEVIAEDTYITLGSINGEYYTSVDSEIYYDGSSITRYTLTPEWD